MHGIGNVNICRLRNERSLKTVEGRATRNHRFLLMGNTELHVCLVKFLPSGVNRSIMRKIIVSPVARIKESIK